MKTAFVNMVSNVPQLFTAPVKALLIDRCGLQLLLTSDGPCPRKPRPEGDEGHHVQGIGSSAQCIGVKGLLIILEMPWTGNALQEV